SWRRCPVRPSRSTTSMPRPPCRRPRAFARCSAPKFREDHPVTIRVGVFGAAGRMGQTVCAAVEGDAELELAARMDIGDERDPSIDVAVDFTAAEAARENARWCAANGIHAVIGTSGITEADHAELRAAF